jgi:hypothetical protein
VSVRAGAAGSSRGARPPIMGVVVSGRILVAVTLALLVGGAVVVAQGGARPGRPQPKLRLMAFAPVSVRGSGFGARERIRLRLRSLAVPGATARVRASRAGRFTASFAVAVDRCSAFSVTAVGRTGRRATARWRAAPKCPAA